MIKVACPHLFVPIYLINGIVPKGKAIVWGSNFESFDSRYWGFIDYKKLKKMKIIW